MKILARVMWPYTFPFLQLAGLKEGMKCLDVGCGNGEFTRRIAEIIGPKGHITGIDFDPAIIAIAQDGSGNDGNIEFSVMDIAQDEPDDEAYDFIFCRFILSHLQSPAEVVQRLFSALKAEGVLAVEDVDFGGSFSYPPSEAFDQYVRWYTGLGIQKGSNPRIGPLLVELIKSAGFQHIRMNVEMPTFFEGDGKRMALLTLQAISQRIIMEKLATKEEVDEAIHELETYSKDASSIISMPRIFQVNGIKKL